MCICLYTHKEVTSSHAWITNVVPLCHKSLGVPATSLPPSILLSSLPSCILEGVWAEPAAKHVAAVYTVKQSCKIHIDVSFTIYQVGLSACMQSSATVLELMLWRGTKWVSLSVYNWTPLPESEGSGPQNPPQDRCHWQWERVSSLVLYNFHMQVLN